MDGKWLHSWIMKCHIEDYVSMPVGYVTILRWLSIVSLQSFKSHATICYCGKDHCHNFGIQSIPDIYKRDNDLFSFRILPIRSWDYV